MNKADSMNKLDNISKPDTINRTDKLFIPFISAGYPNLQITKEIILECNHLKIPYLELGIPYSDPVADGPTIQKASEIALANGTNLDQIFNMLERLPHPLTSKLIIFSYYNPLFTYGFQRFCERCKKTGVYGVLIPDLPVEEESEVLDYMSSSELVLIPLVAPTSVERLEIILNHKERGFIYCVSSLGVTGERQQFNANLEQFIGQIRAVSDLPIAIGFGISNREQAEQLGAIADGVVVGSKIINIITEALQNHPQQPGESINDQAEKVARYVRKQLETLCPYQY